MGKTLVYYHKHDLRLHDNPILDKLKDGSYTSFLPIYIFPPHQMELGPLLKPSISKNPEKGGEVRGQFGAWRTGNFRVQYLCESVWDLKQNYEKRGTTLVIKAGRAETILPSLIKSIKEKQEGGEVDLWLQDEYTTEEVDEFKRIRTALHDLAQVKTVEDNTLVSIHDLPYSLIDKLPNFYTEFRKNVEPLNHVRDCFETPGKFPSMPEYGTLETDYDVPETMDKCIEILCRPLGGLPKIPENTAHPMAGGETSALARLEHYCQGGKDSPAAHYKETRNQMLGADFSTKFSSFLSLGTISPKLIHHRVSQLEKECHLEGDVNTYWIRFELLWRDYFKFVGKKYGSHLFRKRGLKQKPISDTWLGPDSKEAQRWKSGTTGVGIVDAAMRELNQTGYMSNRTRQIVASFLCKDLYVDWRIGAEHFEEKLLDHDAASNWGNWQYQAGVGNDPRGARRFNPAKQTHDYDPKGEYIKTWCPEVAKVTDKLGYTYFWTIGEKLQKTLKLEADKGVIDPVKGMCGSERERAAGQNGMHRKGFKGGKTTSRGR